jgi:hypothetical protein
MNWKHLIALNLLALHALVIVLNYFGILGPLVTHLGGNANQWMPETWTWLHGIATSMNGFIIENSGLPFTRQSAGLLFLFCLAAQDLMVGYTIGSIMDLPWRRWLGREKEEAEVEEKEHRDLRIAMRAMDKIAQAEKDRLKEKVERLKRKSKEQTEDGQATTET